MKLADYEIKGSYLTAAKDVDTYVGWLKGNVWQVSPKPTGLLPSGNTYPSRMEGVREVRGTKYAYTIPIKGKSGLVSATFMKLTEDAFSDVSKDVLAKGTEYGKASGRYDMGFLKKLVIGLCIGIGVVYIAGVYIKSHK